MAIRMPILLAAIWALAACATPTQPAAALASDAVVRSALEDAYNLNREALLARDAAAAIAVRTEDFHVVTPDGRTHDAREMADFTRNLLANVERWDALSFTIDSVERAGNQASAEVRQHSKRLMRRPTGTTQLVENWVTQRETWVETPQGWRIRRVDNIRDQQVLIDGIPRP